MGEIKAKLERHLSVQQIVQDLAVASGDTEGEASAFLADLIDADWRSGKLKFFCKAPSHIKGAKGLGASRRVDVQAGSVSIRLREAARSGLQQVRALKHADGETGLAGIYIDKRAMMAALTAEGLTVPGAWSGTAKRAANELPAQRRARLSQEVKTERSRGNRAPLKTVAGREGISTSRLKQLTDPTPAKKADKDRGRGRSS